MDKKGQWYTDENGNHYFVEDGQSPKEGWEASKRRKMISGGKYMTSEDGNDYREVNKDEYDNYESDETDFDENNEDDFGFDEYEDDENFHPVDDFHFEEAIQGDIETATDKQAFEAIADRIDKATEEGIISEEMADALYAKLDEKIDESGERMPLYNTKMAKGQEENAAMSKNEQANVDALYRPDEDKGPRESKGPADPNAPAGQVLYNSDDEEFLKDMGANLKNTQYGRQETLDEYYERVKDKHTDDMDDWKAFISTAYAMSPKEVDRYIKLKESQSREPEESKGNPYDPEKLPDEGMSQEELDDGWKVTSGSAVPGGRGGHTDYDDGKGNWITDWGNGKVYAYLDGKSLGKKFSSVDEAKAALNKKLGKEKNKSEAIEHKPVDMPKYHREKDHIVIDEGPNKGESYDTEEDYYNSVRSEGKNEDDFQAKYDRFTSAVGKFNESQGSDQDLDEMISSMRKDYSDEEIIRKLAMAFRGHFN